MATNQPGATPSPLREALQRARRYIENRGSFFSQSETLKMIDEALSTPSETAPLVAGDLAKQREIHDTYAPVSAIEEREEWLIWSNEHNAWWGPNSCGYNWHADNAGRYTLTEAMKHCTSRSWDDRIPPESMIHISALPKECHEPV